jgi:hypothetical protein
VTYQVISSFAALVDGEILYGDICALNKAAAMVPPNEKLKLIPPFLSAERMTNKKERSYYFTSHCIL